MAEGSTEVPETMEQTVEDEKLAQEPAAETTPLWAQPEQPSDPAPQEPAPQEPAPAEPAEDSYAEQPAAAAPPPAAAAPAKPGAPPSKPSPAKPSPPARAAPASYAAPAKPKPAAAAPPKKPAPVAAASPTQKPREAAAGTSPSRMNGKFTFSGAPNTATAKKMDRADYSHSNYEVLKITEDNNKLCKRLLEISSGAPKPASGPARPVAASMSPAGINRRRAEDRIAQENLAIYKRLQAVKPSRDVSREAHNKHYQAQTAYGNNARKVRDPQAQGSPPRGATQPPQHPVKQASPPPAAEPEGYGAPEGEAVAAAQ